MNHPIATPQMPSSFRPRIRPAAHEISAVESVTMDGSGEAKWHGRRAGVTGVLDDRSDFFAWDPESFGHGIHDASVCLMRNEERNLPASTPARLSEGWLIRW
jgi:hypothetical protein